MSNIPQIRKMIKHRLSSMVEESKNRFRFGNKQQVEELIHLFEMLEREVKEGNNWEEEAQ